MMEPRSCNLIPDAPVWATPRRKGQTTMKQRKHVIAYLLLALLLVLADQLLKGWVRAEIPFQGSRKFLPGLVQLTYVENTGGAFSILSAHTWILTAISALAVLLLVLLLWRGIFPSWMGRLSLALILGGAAGNLIDRLLFGSVTDMFQLMFMKFAVFNVADIAVCSGGVLLCLYVLFVWEKERAHHA